MDLGMRREQPELAPQPMQSEAPKISYPSFTIDDKERVQEFLEEHPVEMDDEITCTVKLRVSGMRNDEYGTSLSFNIVSIDGKSDSREEEHGEQDETWKEYPNPAVGRLMSRREKS